MAQKKTAAEWVEIIEFNRGAIEAKIREMYAGIYGVSSDYHESLGITPDGDLYTWEDVGSGDFAPEDIWDGTDLKLITIDGDGGSTREQYLQYPASEYQVMCDLLSDEQLEAAKKAAADKSADYYGSDEMIMVNVIREMYPEIDGDIDADAKAWMLEDLDTSAVFDLIVEDLSYGQD